MNKEMQTALQTLRETSSENWETLRELDYNEDLVARQIYALWLAINTLTIVAQALLEDISRDYKTDG